MREPPVQAEAILNELHRVWASLSAPAAGEEPRAVLRACTLTLIVLTAEPEGWAAIDETIATLMREHPSRAIVVRLRPAAAAVLEFQVRAQCWIPLEGERQVCSEQIEISAGQGGLVDLVPVLLGLIAPDLPVIVWCRGAPVVDLAGLEPLLPMANKLIVDSGAFPEPRIILRQIAAAPGRRPVIADLSWTRLTRWRELIAQLFDSPANLVRVPEISEVTIAHGGEAVPVPTFYLGAWLATALGWESPDGRLRFEAAPGASVQPLQGVTLRAPGFGVRLRLADGSAVEAEVDGAHTRVILPPSSEPVLLREEIRISGPDPIYDIVRKLAAGFAEA